MSVTPYCGPICGKTALIIDSAMAADLAAHGDGLGAIMTLAPVRMGTLVKSQMRARTLLSPQVINIGEQAVAVSALITILAAPERSK